MTARLTISLLSAALALPAALLPMPSVWSAPAARAATAATTAASAQPVTVPGDTAVLIARDAFRAGDAAKLARAAAQVGDHVLLPYVQFWQLRLRLEDRRPEELTQFLARNPDTLLAEQLRRDWLKLLGKGGDWERFREQAPLVVGDDPEISCYSLAARWQVKDTSAIAELRRIWRTPREMPEPCARLAQTLLHPADPVPPPGAGAPIAFDRWDASAVWERFRILVEAGQLAAARRVLDYLPRQEAPDARQLELAWNSPLKVLERPAQELLRRSQKETYIVAVSRAARNDPLLGASYFDGRARERFAVEDRAYVLGLLATAASRRHLPEAMGWFTDIAAMGGDAQLNDEQLGWRARIALRQGNWEEVRAAVLAMSPTPQGRNDSTWVYWLGRAYQAQKADAAARAQFQRIAAEHSFYGRLAAEELGLNPSLPETAAVPTSEELASAGSHGGLQRALALYRLEMRSEGMREWIWAIRGMDDRSLLAAAELARRHEIWDRAINTADRTQKEHNFNVRYLAPYRDVLGTAARARSLDEPLVLGLVRQESRFMSFAKSTVGASGLMQLMPATAAWVAGKMGMRDYAWSRVHHPEVNAKLGTFYLRQVLDELGGHPVVAAAAYNAGPGRARRWRDIRPLEGAIYAETIPFTETRDYAKKVMVNSIYYAAVQGQARSLKARLGVVTIGRPAEEATAAARVLALP